MDRAKLKQEVIRVLQDSDDKEQITSQLGSVAYRWLTEHDREPKMAENLWNEVLGEVVDGS